MEFCLSSSFNINNPFVIVSDPLPFSVKNSSHLKTNSQPRFAVSGSSAAERRRSKAVVAGASSFSSGGSGYCGFSCLNTPIEPKTPAGRFLSSVLLNERKFFHDAVAETLEKLVAERDEAHARRALTVDSSEACLHRRIAELKERECQNAVEDVMYMLILYKFSEIRVHLIPRLSNCIYNGRLEILPSKDWELESIHTFEVLEMIREHLTSVVGWRADFNVTENWATTKINRSKLCQIYTASILFGYFLKSATLRHQLEMTLATPIDDHVLLPEFHNYRQKNAVFGHTHITTPTYVGGAKLSFDNIKKREKLSSYLMGFSPESLVKCAQPNSKASINLITNHSCALFGNENSKIFESDEVILTSLASLKRFVLEAIAFGSYLWDAEEYVKTAYNLDED